MLIVFGADADRVLLILTTLVSLEAIYLSLFIQISVNRNTEDIAEIYEDIEEIAEDVEDIAEDVEGIERDIDEIQVDVAHIEHDIEEIAEDVEGIEEDIDGIAEDVEDIAEEIEDDDSDPAIMRVGATSQSNNQILIELMSEIRSLRKEILEIKDSK
jgi:chromosome segregation ATPase